MNTIINKLLAAHEKLMNAAQDVSFVEESLRKSDSPNKKKAAQELLDRITDNMNEVEFHIIETFSSLYVASDIMASGNDAKRLREILILHNDYGRLINAIDDDYLCGKLIPMKRIRCAIFEGCEEAKIIIQAAIEAFGRIKPPEDVGNGGRKENAHDFIIDMLCEIREGNTNATRRLELVNLMKTVYNVQPYVYDFIPEVLGDLA
jgi:hypothetical protein